MTDDLHTIDLPSPPAIPDSHKTRPSLEIDLTALVFEQAQVSPIAGATLLASAAKLAKNTQGSSPVTPVVSKSMADGIKKLHALTPSKHKKVFFEGQIRPVAITAFEDLLFLTRIAKWKVAYHEGLPFNRIARVDEELVRDALEKTIAEIWDGNGCHNVAEGAKARSLAEVIVSPFTPLATVIGALQKSFELCNRTIERVGGSAFTSIDAGAKSTFELTVKHNPDRLVIDWSSTMGSDLLSALTTNAETMRKAEVDPNFVDFLTYHIGYEMLRAGAKLDASEARWLGTPGFRQDTQTFVSLTDPGEGHIFGTTRKARWLKGAICHVEHLERPGNLPRDEIESYRIPSIFEFARVRLHTGKSAPNTYFVGRRVKDSVSGNFALDFIKVVNLTSAACSAAFQLGAAEAKVAMDGLTASEQIAYMRGLSGHVLRNHKQVLSAAYNLNAPLVDDLAPGSPVLMDNIAVARRGIELAALGGFDKVTFDGASDTYPSQCVILQISFENALELVHLAHQAGLITYMSAGFKFGHIAHAVYSGVDGIGIGGAQILRYMDGKTGHHGPYTEEFIDKICSERDEAAASIRGRGVNLMCRLDRMFYEGSITADEEMLREPLFKALGAIDENAIAMILSAPAMASVLAMEHDGEKPVLANAKRLLRDSGSTLLKTVGMESQWTTLVRDLAALVAHGDEESLAQYYLSQPWTSLREEYATKTNDTTRCDRLYTIKSAPHAP